MVEYRVLSSAMMKDVDTLSFVWEQLGKAIYNFNRGSSLIDDNLIRNVINNSDAGLARQVISDYNIF